nr:hypothetical protein [Candidatus Sigynarchaeota archaeon]
MQTSNQTNNLASNTKHATTPGRDPAFVFTPAWESVLDWKRIDDAPLSPREPVINTALPARDIAVKARRLGIFVDEHGYFARVILDMACEQVSPFLPGRAIHVLAHVPSRGHGSGIPEPERGAYRVAGRGLHAGIADGEYRAVMKRPAWIPRAGRFSLQAKVQSLRDDGDYLESMNILVACNDLDVSFPPGLGLASTVRLRPVETFTMHRLELRVHGEGDFLALRLDVELDRKPAELPGKVLHVLHWTPASELIREPCSACGQPDPGMFAVPDATWNLVVDERLRKTVICFPCFQRLARAKRRELRGYEAYFSYNWASFLANMPGNVEFETFMRVKNK